MPMAPRSAIGAGPDAHFSALVGIALGYEDLNDHDELRHDPIMASGVCPSARFQKVVAHQADRQCCAGPPPVRKINSKGIAVLHV